MKKQKAAYCTGCGHRLDKHRTYANNGANRHGCRLVCIVDGCGLWNQCQAAAPQETDQ